MSGGAIAGMCVGVGIFCLIVGIIIGIYIARKMVRKQLDENPIITEQQIRAMYAQMGRTPSEQQVKKMMATMKSKSKNS
ncbi:MAG: YneF family protein [Mycoplasmoidaceae bacterium]|nr:YneF family protein [Mycoplasmoidaceae bacterium]